MASKEALQFASIPLILAGAGLLGFSLVTGIPESSSESNQDTTTQRADTSDRQQKPSLAFPEKEFNFTFPGQRAVDVNISFVSITEFETINGTLANEKGNLKGDLAFDGKTLQGSGLFTVDVASMRTGIGARDDHMRNYLEAEKHPAIVFELKELSHLDGDTFQAEGSWTMKGIKKDISFQAKLKRISEEKAHKAGLNSKPNDGDWLAVEANFPITLSDFNIKFDGKAKNKVSDTWNVRVDLRGKHKS